VQHLGYHEFVELGRVAHRTITQKKIIVNNLAIRRATEALSRTNDFYGVDRILRDAFQFNDFDGFDMTLSPALLNRAANNFGNVSHLNWQKTNGVQRADNEGEWTLALDLKDPNGHKLGTFSLYRKCSGSSLLVDVNLLISGFNVALAEALVRLYHTPAERPSDVRDAHRILSLSDKPAAELAS